MQAGSQSMTPFLLEAPLFALCLSGKVWSAAQEASTFSFECVIPPSQYWPLSLVVSVVIDWLKFKAIAHEVLKESSATEQDYGGVMLISLPIRCTVPAFLHCHCFSMMKNFIIVYKIGWDQIKLLVDEVEGIQRLAATSAVRLAISARTCKQLRRECLPDQG